MNLLKTIGLFALGFIFVLFWGHVVMEILSILFGGCVFAFLLSPLCRLMEKKIGPSPAALVSLAMLGLLLVSAAMLLLPLILRKLSSLVDLLPEALTRLRGLAENLLGLLQRKFPDFTLPNISSLEGRMSGIARGAVSIAGDAAGGIYRLFLMAVLSYFLLADRQRILLRLELLTPFKWRRLCVRAGNMLMRELRLYLRGQASIALAVGILSASALTIIGVPGAALLGLLVGMFNVIPYLGPFLGGIPAVLMALSLNWQRAALTILALFLVQQIDGMVISPRIMGNITGFSPAVVLLAIFVGARIGSIGGMLFALPTLMAVRTVYRVFVQRHENN